MLLNRIWDGLDVVFLQEEIVHGLTRRLKLTNDLIISYFYLQLVTVMLMPSFLILFN